MSSNRIVYQNWIVELGRDPDRPPDIPGPDLDRSDFISLDELPEMSAARDKSNPAGSDFERVAAIREAVGCALEQLSDDEREFVERFYYIGQSYQRISQKSGRAIYKLEAIHKRAIKKLRKLLAPTVATMFGLTAGDNPRCVVCNSEYRGEIDRLIASREPRATWRPVIQTIKKKYGLIITTPQTLIGHRKYH